MGRSEMWARVFGYPKPQKNGEPRLYLPSNFFPSGGRGLKIWVFIVAFYIFKWYEYFMI